MRVIITKYRIYELAADEQGVPVEQYFANAALPPPLKDSGAKVYDTMDGPVIAMPGGRGQCAARKPPHSKKPQP
jgi:hypothetical protein